MILIPKNGESGFFYKLFSMGGYIFNIDETTSFKVVQEPELVDSYLIEIKDRSGTAQISLRTEVVLQCFKMSVLEKFKQKIKENNE